MPTALPKMESVQTVEINRIVGKIEQGMGCDQARAMVASGHRTKSAQHWLECKKCELWRQNRTTYATDCYTSPLPKTEAEVRAFEAKMAEVRTFEAKMAEVRAFESKMAARDAAHLLIMRAVIRWAQVEGSYRDDISAVVVYLAETISTLRQKGDRSPSPTPA